MRNATDERLERIQQVEEGVLGKDAVIGAFVRWCTSDDANEMHPRFLEDEED